jgi:hypothetical protein
MTRFIKQARRFKSHLIYETRFHTTAPKAQLAITTYVAYQTKA